MPEPPFTGTPRSRSRRLPEIDPAVRKRFESLDLGQRRPGDRIVLPRTEDARSFSIPRGDASAKESSRAPRALLWIAVLLLVALAGHAVITRRPLWTAQDVRVEGNRSVDATALLASLGVDSGMPWWRLASIDRESTLATFPRIGRLSLAYRFPRGLDIRVEERSGLFRWWGEPVRVIATDGTVLAEDPELDPADLPLLSAVGMTPGAPGSRVAFAGAGDWWSLLREVHRSQPGLWASISEVQYEGERRFRVFFRGPKRVVVWDPHLNAHLWERVPFVLEDLAARGVGQDAVLDLRFRDRIVVRIPEEEWYRLKEAEGSGPAPVPDASEGTATETIGGGRT